MEIEVNGLGAMVDRGLGTNHDTTAISFKLQPEYDTILRNLSDRSARLRRWTIEGMQRDGLLPMAVEESYKHDILQMIPGLIEDEGEEIHRPFNIICLKGRYHWFLIFSSTPVDEDHPHTTNESSMQHDRDGFFTPVEAFHDFMLWLSGKSGFGVS